MYNESVIVQESLRRIRTVERSEGTLNVCTYSQMSVESSKGNYSTVALLAHIMGVKLCKKTLVLKSQP